MQKLRKKAGLQPTDEVTLLYKIDPAGHDLFRIISEHITHIETSTKNPLVHETSASLSGKTTLVREECDLKGAKMTLTLTKGFDDRFKRSGQTVVSAPILTHGQPKCKYVNVVHLGKVATIILENPIDSGNVLAYNQLCEEVQTVFEISASSVKLYHQGEEITTKHVCSISGKTLTTASSMDNKLSTISGSLCPFVDVEYQGKKGTLLLENPVGCRVTHYLNQVLSTLFGSPVDTTKKLKNGNNTWDLKSMTTKQWDSLNGKTVNLVL